jgi:ESCRT-I complex subunit VPS37
MFAQIVEIRINEQITELVTKFKQAKVVDRKSGTITVPVTNRNVPGLALTLTLPKDYPKVAPLVSVVPANVNHPWVQRDVPGRVWHDSFQKFYYQQDELALVKLVSVLLDAFKAAGTSGQRPSGHQQQHQQQPKANVSTPMPGIDVSFEDIKMDIKKLSSEELVNLLTDKEAYAKYVANMKQLSNMGSSTKELVTKNQAVAESSQEKQSQIAELKNQIAIIRSTEVLEVKHKYEELAKEHNSILSSINVNTLKEKLSDAANEEYEASEDLSQKLMDKEISVEKFVDQYCKRRELYHKRTMVLQSLDH